MRLLSLLQIHIVNYMMLLLSAYKTKLVINMIIKRNVKKINALSLYLLYELRPVVHVPLFTSGNPNPCAYDMRLWAVKSLYLTLTYMKYIHKRKV